jgi:hypothetical protein
MSKGGIAYMANDMSSADEASSQSNHGVSVFRLTYQAPDNRVGFDSDNCSRSIALLLLQGASAWNCSEDPFVVYDKTAPYAHDAHLFLKGVRREERWLPRVSFSEPSANLLTSIQHSLERNDWYPGRIVDVDWEVPGRLLGVLARCAEEFSFACIWRIGRMDGTVIVRSGADFTGYFRSLCGSLGAEVRQVAVESLPDW